MRLIYHIYKKKASIALQKIVAEMEHRYDTFSEKNVKNIGGYNDWVEKYNYMKYQAIKDIKV